MARTSAILSFFFLVFYFVRVQADVLLVASLPQHVESVAITGESHTCRTPGEAAYRCEMTDGCRGAWFHNNGTMRSCQAAICPSSPGKLNPVPAQAGFFFLFTGTFDKGNQRNSTASVLQRRVVV